MSNEPINPPPSNQLAGTIFSTQGEGNKKPVHWKRHLVISVYPYALFIADLILIVVIFGVLVMLRYDVSMVAAISRRVLLAILLPSVLGMYIAGGYNYATDKSKYRFLSEYLITAAGVSVVAFGLIYSVVAYGLPLASSRMIVAGSLILFPLAAIIYRVLLTRLQHRFERGNVICIIGAGTRARDLYQRLKARGGNHSFLVLSFDKFLVGRHLLPGVPDSPVIEGCDVLELNSSIRGKYVESYVVATDMEILPEEVSQRLVVALFNNHRIFTYEHFLENHLRIVPPSQLSLSWPLQEGFRLNRSLSYDRVKRGADIVAALIGFIIAGPVMLLTAIAVKLTSPGPIIFKQPRTGLRQKTFMIYKFRSMTVGSEKGSKYTSPNDVRFTSIGKFIRKTRIDELPQLWNVLKGDLSLIGPRAEWVDLVRRYEARFPFYHFRHAVKPGITGWAQVNYSYGASEEDTLEKLNYDLYYVRRYSLSLDVAIVVKTIYMMLFGRGQ